MWIQILWRILWAIRPYKAFFQKLSASWTFLAKIVKIDHVVLHNFGSFPPKALWVRFVGHRCGYKFRREFYGLSGHIKRFNRNFQLHGIFWPKSLKSTMSFNTTLAVFRPKLFRFDL